MSDYFFKYLDLVKTFESKIVQTLCDPEVYTLRILGKFEKTSWTKGKSKMSDYDFYFWI